MAQAIGNLESSINPVHVLFINLIFMQFKLPPNKDKKETR